jgi:hypothetical protein
MRRNGAHMSNQEHRIPSWVYHTPQGCWDGDEDHLLEEEYEQDPAIQAILYAECISEVGEYSLSEDLEPMGAERGRIML